MIINKPDLEKIKNIGNIQTLKNIRNIRITNTNKEYSGIDTIPNGHASEKLTEGCLVLEGGAFRGMYSQGFTDALMLKGYNFSCVIGTSAGALCGINYVSGQIGRGARTNLKYRHDSRFVGARAFLHDRSPVDVTFLTEDRGIFEPLDEERFYRPEQRFLAVAANCLTGEATYFEKGKCSNILKAVQASATMPFISPMVMIDDVPYLDGGASCKIPYQWAIDQGYKKIVVIRTRDVTFRKPDKLISQALTFYRKYPEFAESLAHSNFAYNRQCDEIEELHAQGRLFRFAPTKPVTVSRVESDMEKLGELYWLGYDDCMIYLDELEDYLSKTE